MNKSLTSLPEFLKELPQKLKISENQQRIIIVDTLKSTITQTTTDINVGKDTHLTFIAFLKTGWEESRRIRFNLMGENSTVNFLCFIIARDKNGFTFETESNHTVPHTNANYYIRAAMFDKARLDYTGRLNIKPEAQLTNSYLSHSSLMLSEDAKVRTVPSLEIEADDVKAGHAATIGNVDEDLLFYCKSRGLSQQQAREVLITGFMQTDIKRIPSEEVQQVLVQEIEASIC